MMKYLGTFLLLFLFGCTISPPFQKAKINGVYEILGAKIYSPKELEWYIVQHTQNSIVFGKSLSSHIESVVASATLFKVEGVHEDRAFLESVISEREKSNDKERFVNLNVDNEFTTFKGYNCFNYNTLSEDHQSISKSKKEFQYFSTIGMVCRHFANKNMAVQVEVSYRADSKVVPNAIKRTADHFISNLELLNHEVF